MATVLIVDGNAQSRAELAGVLTHAGWQVQTCSTAAEVIRRLSAIAPDVLVTEVHLPDLPAWELLPRIRAFDPELPVIALTADDSWETSRRVRVEAGPVFYYGLKPVNPTELQRVVQSAERWHRRRDGRASIAAPKEAES